MLTGAEESLTGSNGQAVWFKHSRQMVETAQMREGTARLKGGFAKYPRTYWIATGLVALAGAYLLSVGPAYYLLRKQCIPQQAFTSIYGPLVRFCESHNGVRSIFDWYCDLWYSDIREFEKGMKEMKSQEEVPSSKR